MTGVQIYASFVDYTMNTENVKLRSVSEQIGLLLRLVGFCLVAQVAMGLLLGSVVSNASPMAAKLLQMLATFVLFGIPAIIFMRITFVRQGLYQLGFRPADKTLFYLFGIFVLLFAFPFEAWLGIVNRHFPLPESMIKMEDAAEQQVKTLLTATNGFEVAFNLVVVAVVPAIFEEMFFRGVMQRLLMGITKRPWVAICITAAVFSFMHYEFLGFLPRFFLGILLGAMFFYSGSIWTCVLAHGLFNGVQVLLLNYSPEFVDNKNPSIPAYAVLLSLVSVIVLLAVMRRQSQQSQSAEMPEASRPKGPH